VNVSYVNEGDNRFVSVSGKGELVSDKAKMEELWNPLYKAWFPQGLEDSELTLLRVQVERVEYWDSASSTLTQLVGFVKGVVTGKKADVGEYGQLDVPH
jgi:general stress protein 26